MSKSLKSLVTCLARCILGALAWRVPGIDTLHAQGQAQAHAKGDAVPLEIVGRNLQAMVYVKGMHLARPALGAGQQQRRGVRPAAEGHSQRKPGRESLHGGIETLGHGADARTKHNGPAGPSAVAPNA